MVLTVLMNGDSADLTISGNFKSSVPLINLNFDLDELEWIFIKYQVSFIK